MNRHIQPIEKSQTFLWARRFLAARERARERSRLRDDTFRLDHLEDRILLSADPLLATDESMLNSANDQNKAVEYVENWESPAHGSESEISLISSTEAKIIYDIAGMEFNPPSMDSALVISAEEVLIGSGSIDLDVHNIGKVAPGYSPGIQIGRAHV